MTEIGNAAATRVREDAPASGERFWASPATWAVLAGAAAVFLVGLGAPSYETHDVSRYAQMVLEMRHAHTLVPTLEGHPYHEAAPLAAWAPYFSAWAIGGLSPLAVRLPSALAALATCVLVLGLARRYSARAGWIAGAAIVLNELALTYGRGSRIEPLLGLAVAGAVISFVAGARAAPGRRLLLWTLAGASTALGIAAKGPAAVALIGAAALPVLLYERRWRALLVGGAVAGGIALLLTAAWLVPYLLYLGPGQSEAFYRQFLLLETVAKITNGYGKAEPFWTYAVEMLPKLAPWSLLAAAALWRVLRRPAAATGVERLCASWLLFPVLLLSAAAGKHMRYVVPVMPALAVLAGVELDRWLDVLAGRRLRGVGVALGAIGALVAVCGVAAPIALAVLYGPGAYAFASGLLAAIAGVATLLLARQQRHAAALLSLYLGAAAVVVFVFAAVFPLPVVSQRQPYQRLADALVPHLSPADTPLWVVEPDDPARRVSASELALHLDRWVEPVAAGGAPEHGVILAPALLSGSDVRARIEWRRHKRGDAESWYLLDAAPAPAPGG